MASFVPKLLVVVFGLAALVFLLGMVSATKRKRIVDVLAVLLIGYAVFHNYSKSSPAAPPSEFARAVELAPLQSIAVQSSGRIKSFDSFARTMMRYVSGPHRIAGQHPAFTYFDMMFRPQAYTHADVIYVKKKQIRRRIADQLARIDAVRMPVLETFQETGLISPALLREPVVISLLDQLETNLMRTARPVNEIRSALSVANPATLSRNLRTVPPPGGAADDPWYLAEDIWGGGPADAVHSGMSSRGNVPGLDPGLAAQITRTWSDLAAAWRGQDADRVNDLLARCAALIRSIEPSLYPDLDKLKLENWYFRYKSMTWIWLIYAAAVIPLLMSVIYRWNGARMTGIAFFLMAFGLHTASLGIRWHISGRIPNSNMFEAITAATWFGGVAALVLELLTRKTPMRSIFFLGAACAAMVASMCANFMPMTLTSDIDNIMPILDDLWLYIHTNMIIWSYAMIGMAAVTALLYLRHRIGGGSPDAAVLGGAGSLIMKGKQSFITGNPVTFAQVLDGATMVLMEVSFIALWTGLVMGAIWADHSWGRPWGWDPKEVFALNTFIIFLLLVHVRFKVRDKGLWTAILAGVGCCVMLFNWIVINFIITGLHSYA